MLKELEEMSKGQKLYNYECKSCGFEKGVPEFILEELRQDVFFSSEKLYNYECKSCGFEKGVPEFILEELRQDVFFSSGAVASLNEKNMPELICPNCGAKFEYKTTDNR